ncbi:hypothetical protein FRC01_001616 [Tulasnella sp. 417]|nr:hypothetical protein FRC01_001616 [Tulasnella sp. 417]
MVDFTRWNFDVQADVAPLANVLLLLGSTLALYKLSGHVLRDYILVPKVTILKDIQKLHLPRSEKIRGRVVICGGSIAGLLAAAVCADHFESVIVVESEVWVKEHGAELPKIEDRLYRMTSSGYQTVAAPRTRVMQYYFGNHLQPPVFLVFSRLFPDLQNLLDRLGLTKAIIVAKMKMGYGGIYLKDPHLTDDITSGVPLMLNLTREATEAVLRKAVMETRPNVTSKSGTVSGFLGDEGFLSGVTVKVGDMEETEQADFVIDATGPAQMSYSKWLRAAGFPIPSDLRIEYDPMQRYTTCIWTIPPHLQSKWPVPGGFKPGLVWMMSCDFELGDPRAIGFALKERNQLFVNLGGAAVPSLVHSMAELRSYTQSLRVANSVPDWIWKLYDFLEDHEEELKPFWVDARIPPMNWVQWHKIAGKSTALPRNWVSVGDANMILNPLYGHGVFKACVEATTLDCVLRSISPASWEASHIPTRFFERQVPRGD